MKKLALISVVVALASGCASTSQNLASSDYQFEEVAVSTQQARAYVEKLNIKKQRFIEKQLLAKAAAYSDPALIAANSDVKADLSSECKGIANSDWAKSVLYGQDFLSYQNHVETMKRCLEQEQRASLSDVTTAMK